MNGWTWHYSSRQEHSAFIKASANDAGAEECVVQCLVPDMCALQTPPAEQQTNVEQQ
jgi:hypothetical protein